MVTQKKIPVRTDARERSVRLAETLSTRERVEMRAVANRRGVCAR